MIRKRSNPKPLHNFALPRLQCGNRKQTRCMRTVNHLAWPSSSSSSISAAQLRSSVLPSFVRKRLADLPGEEEEEDCGEGIEAVRKKLMLDLRAETDKIKKELLKVDDEEEEAETVAAPVAGVGKKMVGTATTARHEEERVIETRPWSMRTRRAACKSPAVAAAMNDSPARKECVSAARDAKALPEKGKERVKFAVALKKKEIKEDFVKLTGHQPPRRPKKRRCTVQKKLNMLFPGLWLTQVTADTYRVEEVPDNGKG